jgi:ABC-type Na+ transport system ATPase subunit NatA
MEDNKTVLPATSSEPSIVVRNLISAEHYKQGDELIPLLDGLSFEVAKGTKLGIGASKEEELVALVEILGNMRSYYKGYVKLSSLGTRAKKKSVVEQIFYLDSPQMLYEDMNLLEHLMFVKKISADVHDVPFNEGQEQKATLDLIKEAGLDEFVLTRIKKMPESVKLITAIAVALLSDSEKVVINAAKFSFTYNECFAIKALFRHFNDKTIILGTFDNKLIGMACDHVLYISQGKLKTFSTVDELYKNWDKVTCSIKTTQAPELISLIYELAEKKQADCLSQGGYVYVKYLDPAEFLGPVFFAECQKREISIADIRINQGRVANAFEEIGGEKI